MKKTLVVIALIGLGAGLSGGLYLYRNGGGFKPELPDLGEVEGEQIDEAVVPSEPTTFVNSGPAPELVGLSGWLNIGQRDEPSADKQDPPTLEDLRGKVVLVNFWTYSCIDCTRTLPYLTKWQNTYRDQGLVVLGIHTPQFNFEKVAGNVASAVKGQGITYPVAQDNDYKTWQAFHNQFWPAIFLINQDGLIVYSHFGGDKFGKTEKAIRTLLGLEGEYKIPDAPAATNPDQTPNIFTGLVKLGKSYGGTEDPSTEEQIYVFPKKVANHKFALEGSWQFGQESITQTKSYGRLLLNFNAAQLNMVASSVKPATVKVYIDDKLVKGVVIKDQGPYQLYDSLTPKAHTLRLEIPDNNLQIFSFEFK
jgi:thiol-disulfide isomerase/thioredoxin